MAVDNLLISSLTRFTATGITLYTVLFVPVKDDGGRITNWQNISQWFLLSSIGWGASLVQFRTGILTTVSHGLIEVTSQQLPLQLKAELETDLPSFSLSPSPVQSSDKRVIELWEKVNKVDWLTQLLLTKPLLIWGEQCSGKTRFATFLALLRVVLFNHEVSVSDPHSHQNSYPNCFDIYGQGYNYGAINDRLVAYYERLKNSYSQPHTALWDEVTQYQENCNSELAGRLLKSLLSDVRKPPEFPIVLSHSNTLGSLGGGKGGTSKMKERGMVEVNLRAKRDRLGNLQPAMKGSVTGLELDHNHNPITQLIELTDWMNPEFILSLFPELNKVKLSFTPEVKTIDFTPEFIPEVKPQTQTEGEFTPFTKISPELVKSVETALKAGKGKSFIITEVLGMKGKNYQKGKELLNHIEEGLYVTNDR